MTEFENRPISRRNRRKRVRKGRVILVSILALVLVLAGIYGVTRFFNRGGGGDVPIPTEQEPSTSLTTFQEKINAEYTAAVPTFDGSEDEATLAVQYFATNLFTMWGVDPMIINYRGQDMIPAEFLDMFNTQVTGNLYFQFPKIVEQYGKENLPIVVEVVPTLDNQMWTTYNDEDYDGYAFDVVMHYQDGTIEGTKNTDQEKANQLLQQWVHSAHIEVFWIPATDGTPGSWKVSLVTNLVNNANAPLQMENATDAEA